MNTSNQITGAIVDAAYRIHTKLGPGLLEHVYETVLAKTLLESGLRVERQMPVAFEFEGIRFTDACRVDLRVEKQVVVELKAVEMLAPVHSRQVLTYLRLLDLPHGLRINFGASKLKDGLHRILNPRASGLPPAPAREKS
ncbi:MAG TPA: GxxExxY protein [Longimicrobium sp.]|nr:GxxExxY protein [Longimicrobium sp.]